MFARNRIFSLQATCIGLLLTFSSATFAAQGVSPNTILIGAFGPITGPAAYIGLGGRDGMNLAVKEINSAGGINGRRLQVVFEDDSHSPTRALAAVKKLVEQEKVFAVFSVAGSNATTGTIDYMKEKGIVEYVSIASAPKVTYPFVKNLFRGGTTEVPRYGELYSEFLIDKLQRKNIAIISGREEYPKNEADALVANLAAVYKIKPALWSEFNIGDKDFTAQLLKATQMKADVIVFLGNPAEGTIALRQAKELGLEQQFFVGSNMVDSSFAVSAKSSGEGAIGFALVPLLPGSKHPDLITWETSYRTEYPKAVQGRPNVFDLLAYADMYVFAKGLKDAGADLTTENFIAALEKINDYRVGPIATPRTFSGKHHIGNLRLQPMVIKSGAWEPIDWQSKRESAIMGRYK